MARAAAKRRQPVRHDHDRRRHKDSGGQRFEDTLFFNRLRKRAKWVFVFLIVVFGASFVLFGVGSSSLNGSLADIFNGIRGSGSGPSLSKELKKAQEHPKDAQAWHDLATAYESKGNIEGAIGAWTTYTSLRPKDPEGWSQLANDYATRLNTQAAEYQAALSELQSAQPSSPFAPSSSSPLGRGLGSVSDPIADAASSTAQQRASAAANAAQTTADQLVVAYQHVAKLEPTNPSDQLLLADAATKASNTKVAIAAYRAFIKLAPYDNQVPYAKQQIKALQSQTQG